MPFICDFKAHFKALQFTFYPTENPNKFYFEFLKNVTMKIFLLQFFPLPTNKVSDHLFDSQDHTVVTLDAFL